MAKPGRPTTPYDPEIAVRILDAIAEGYTLEDVGREKWAPSRRTIYRWLSLDEEFMAAYQRAREISAYSLEDKALAIAAMLEAQNDFNGPKVSGLNYAMQQYRWSAEKRNRRDFGVHANVEGVTQVVIQTTLNLGQKDAPAEVVDGTNVYKLEAPILKRPEPPEEVVEALAPVEDPLAPPPEPPKPRKPRLKKGHKSPAQTKRTATIYARKRELERKKREADGGSSGGSSDGPTE